MSWQFAKEWPKCPDCGLSTPGLHTLEQCRAMKSGKPLGFGKVLKVKKFDVDELPEPPAPNFLGPKPPPRNVHRFYASIFTGNEELEDRSPEEWELYREVGRE